MDAYFGIQKSLLASLKCLKQIDDCFPKLQDFSQAHFSFGLFSSLLVTTHTQKVSTKKVQVGKTG